MTTYIYGLVDPRGEQIRYVGQTVVPDSRLKQHIANGDGSVRKQEWMQELKAARLKPTMKILEAVDDSDALEREAYWISKLKREECNLFNIMHLSEKNLVPVLLRLPVEVVEIIDALVIEWNVSSRNQVVTILVNSVMEIIPASVVLDLPEFGKVTA